MTGTVTVAPGGAEGLSPVVVYVTGFDEDAPTNHVVMSQRDRRFVPGVLVITRGQTVDFSNEDAIWHNVFSVSKARAFDLGMMKKPDTKRITFTKTGLVDIYCNIHPQMAGTILVLPNRAFAVVQPGEAYRIDAIPPGDYKIFAWIRGSEPQQRALHVEGGKPVRVDWQLAPAEALPAHKDKHGREYTRDGY